MDSNRNSPIRLWIVLCSGVVLVAGIYLFDGPTTTPPDESVLNQQLLPEPHASATTSAFLSQAATDWENFSDAEHGLNFNFPSRYTWKDDTYNYLTPLSASSLIRNVLFTNPPDDSNKRGMNLTIEKAVSIPESLGLRQELFEVGLRSSGTKFNVNQSTEINVGNSKALRITYSYPTSNGTETKQVSAETLLAQNKEYLITLSVLWLNEDPDGQTIADEILSSVKLDPR